MLLSRVAINRPVFTTMLMAALVVFGFVCYGRLGVDLFPRVEFPIVTVVTRVPGADPITVESEVTDPIEEAVNTLSGIKHLRSTSADSMSMVVIEFELEKDIDVAFQEITAKVAAVRSRLSTEAEAPVIEKYDVDAAPITTVVVSGDVPYARLARIAEKSVKERLQRLKDVGSARLVGFRDRKMWLQLDPVKLDRHNLSALDVLGALGRQHVEVAGGKIETGPKDVATKLAAEFSDAREFDSLVIAERSGGVVRLADVGGALDGVEEETSRARLDGAPCIAVMVRRQSGANTVEVADAIDREVDSIRREVEKEGVRIVQAAEQAPFIRRSVDEVKHHLVVGGGFAILIVLLFLLNFRSTFISSLVLPTSVIGTFMLMAGMDFTLNMMTMLGLTLAIGLLIDDAIVVQENIMRHVEEGKPARQAAFEAVQEIGLAVVATTLSVVAVFVPVAFMGGLVGRFMAPFALTISAAVLLSMLVSFTLDPMMSSRLLRKTGKRNVVVRGLEGGFAAIERLYGRVLGWTLKHRLVTLLLAAAAVGSVIGLAGRIRFEFVPVEDQSEFNVMVRAPIGASLERTSGIVERVRERIADLPERLYSFSTVGADELRRSNEAQLYVKLSPRKTRARSQSEIMQAVREKLADIDDAVVSVQIVPQMSGGGQRWAQVQYELRGDDLDELHGFATSLLAKMETAGGYVDRDTTFQTGRPEARLRVRRDRAAALGVAPIDVGRTLRAAVGGIDVATFKDASDQYDVGVRLVAEARRETAGIGDLRVRSSTGSLVDIKNVCSMDDVTAPVEIARYNRQRQITVLSNLNGKVLGDATAEIERFAAEIVPPRGLRTAWTGFAETMNETKTNMGFALLLAVLMIYMTLASQFESFLHPLTIMLTLPLAFIGALAALIALDMTMSIYVTMAFIFLMGLVTKNAILLVDYAIAARRKKDLSAEAALLEAGPARLRPILMTTMAMIAGMLPVAVSVGEGSESRQPMAVAIIGGLMSSTLLTLLFVPVVYSLFESMRRGLVRLVGKR